MRVRQDRIWAVVTAAALLLLGGWTFLPELLPSAGPLVGTCVVIDAGHGGQDGGASGNGTAEAQLNLQVALQLEGLLRQAGAEVVMTRGDEQALDAENGFSKNQDMRARRRVISGSGAQAVVSVHMNNYPADGSVHGPQVFYQQGDAAGKSLAECIQRALLTVEGQNHRVPKAGDYYVLDSGVSGVIVECGFLSSASDVAKLTREDYQRQLAWAIYTGLTDYLALSGGGSP